MAGIYKIGFPDKTPVSKAKDQALKTVRKGDPDEVTAGPDIVQTAAHEAAGEYLVRIVTGAPDPRATPPQERPAPAPEGDLLARLAGLTPEQLATFNQLLDKLTGGST